MRPDYHSLEMIEAEVAGSLQTLQAFEGVLTTASSPDCISPSQVQLELENQRLIPVKSGDQDGNLSNADFDRITGMLCQTNREE